MEVVGSEGAAALVGAGSSTSELVNNRHGSNAHSATATTATVTSATADPTTMATARRRTPGLGRETFPFADERVSRS